MQRVTAPGLPSSPALYFDNETKRAKVTVRHPTWHSRERAMKAATLVVLIVFGFLVWLNCQLFTGAPPETVLLLIFGSLITFPIVAFAIRYSLTGFFERQIFPARTTFWFTPNAIAFKSRLYSNPVIVYRNWKNRPVKISFILDFDQEAMNFSNSIPFKKKHPKDHLNHSEILTIVIKAIDEAVPSDHYGLPDAQRSIPVTELSNRLGRKFTLVYAAAASMTAAKPSVVETPRATGTDIDSA